MTEIADSRPSSVRWGAGEAALALVGLAWIALAAFWAAPGVFTVDGFTYLAMIDAFARDGSLFVENGMAAYDAEALSLYLMQDAGGRIAPQYPGGWGILAAPAYLAGGVRGVMLINAVASALTLPLIWAAARALFEDREIALHAALIYGVASFAVEYAVGFWPHGVTIFLVTAAVAAVATGWRGPPAAELRGALLAGLVLGLGLNIRVDAVIAAVPLAVWLLGAGRRPYAAAALLAAGLMPGLAAAAAINHAKFGVLSPLSYGSGDGAVSLAHYARLMPLAAAGGLAALALGIGRLRAALYRPAGLAGAGLAALGLALLLPDARQVLASILRGVWVLVVDFQAHPAPSRGLVELDDGSIRMFGLVKKSLLQSLPYATAALVLVPGLWRGPRRAALAFCFLFVGLGIVPFAYSTWHGGMASNMRYFLNLMPVLAILAAVALARLRGLAAEGPRPGLVAVVAAAGGAVLYAVWRGYPPDFLLQHTLPTAVILGLGLLAPGLWLAPGALRAACARAMLGLFTLGLGTAAAIGWGADLAMSQQIRARNAEMVELAGTLPADALVVAASPEAAGFRVNRPPALTAYIDYEAPGIPADLARLVARAFAEGRPVYVQERALVGRFVALGAAAAATPVLGLPDHLEFFRMAPPRSAR